MRNLIVIIALFITSFALGQIHNVAAVGLDTLTTTEKNALTVPGDRAYLVYDETIGEVQINVKGGGWESFSGSLQSAAQTSITDSGDYYTGTDVEAALQEVGADIAGLPGISDVPFDETWDDDTDGATKNVLYDYLITLLENGTGTVNTTNLLDDSILAVDLDFTGGLTDEYFITYESDNGGFEVVAPPSLSLGGTGNKDLTISYGNTIDLTGVDGIDPLNIPLHPDSPITIENFYFGTTAQIAGAGLGAETAGFPTDSPAAMLLTTTQTVTGNKTFTGTLEIPDGTEISKDPSNSWASLIFDVGGTTRELRGDGSNLFYNNDRVLTENEEAVLEVRSFVIPITAVGASISVGTFKNFVPVHDPITITRVEAHLNTAPAGSTAIFDIKEDGTTILSTLLSIDGAENWSDDATSQAVISDTAVNAKSVLSVDVTQVGSSTPGANGTITIYYTSP